MFYFPVLVTSVQALYECVVCLLHKRPSYSPNNPHSQTMLVFGHSRVQRGLNTCVICSLRCAQVGDYNRPGYYHIVHCHMYAHELYAPGVIVTRVCTRVQRCGSRARRFCSWRKVTWVINLTNLIWYSTQIITMVYCGFYTLATYQGGNRLVIYSGFIVLPTGVRVTCNDLLSLLSYTGLTY